MSIIYDENLGNEVDTVMVRLARVTHHDLNETTEIKGNWAMSYTATNGDSVTLASADYVLSELEQMRGNWLVPMVMTDSDQRIGHVRQLFRNWWNRRKGTYGWIDEMLSRRDYDPLENYDRKEDGGWKDTDDMKQRTDEFTPRTSDTVTETPGVTVRTTQTPKVAMITSKDIYGDNSSTEVPVEKVTSAPDGVNSDVTEVAPVSGTNQTVTTHVGKDQQVYGAHQDEHTRLFQNYRVHGNIGVSTVADMLGKEVELRRPIDLVKLALNEWLDLYTVYVE